MTSPSGAAVVRRFLQVILRSPRYMLLAGRLAQDSRLPAARRAVAGAGLGYALLPLDLVPGIIPILGQLDDLTALIGGVKLALRGCPPELGREHLARVGLAAETRDDDLATLRDTAAGLGREGVSLVGKAGGALARLAAGIERYGLGRLK